MSGAKHGRCRDCDIVWRWTSRRLVRDAVCPHCGEELARTAASLTTRRPVVDIMHVPNANERNVEPFTWRERAKAAKGRQRMALAASDRPGPAGLAARFKL